MRWYFGSGICLHRRSVGWEIRVMGANGPHASPTFVNLKAALNELHGAMAIAADSAQKPLLTCLTQRLLEADITIEAFIELQYLGILKALEDYLAADLPGGLIQ